MSGPRAGAQFVLDARKQNRIGRGLECDIVLTDPLSSRVHAIVTCEQGDWWVRDAGSRNGTYVEGQKADEARLIANTLIKVGSTEFKYCESAERPGDGAEIEHTQTIVRDRQMLVTDTGHFVLEALKDSERAHDFLTLHQLSLKLLSCTDPDDVVRTSLDLLRERTRASVAGFLWAADDGQLKPKLVMPEESSGKVRLSESLTKMVAR
jgi:predicted component of type VI protein secretion system